MLVDISIADLLNALKTINVTMDDDSEKLDQKGRTNLTWEDIRHSKALFRTHNILAEIYREKYYQEKMS